MRHFRRRRTALVALAVLALISNVAVCTLRCAPAAANDPAGLSGSVLGPLAFCAVDPSGGGHDGKTAGQAQHHCAVCHAAEVLVRAAVLSATGTPVAAHGALPKPWNEPPSLAMHIRSGALHSRAPPVSGAFRA